MACRSPPRTIPRHDDALEALDPSVLEEMLRRASPKFAEPFDLSQIVRNTSAGRAARRELDAGSSYGAASSLANASDGGSSNGGAAANGMVPHSPGGARASGSGRSPSRSPSATGRGAGLQGGASALTPAGSGGGGGSGVGEFPVLGSLGCFDAELARQRAALAAMHDDVDEESRVNRELASRILERLEGACKMLEGLSALLGGLAAAEAAYVAALGSAAARVHVGGLEPGSDEELRSAGEALARLPSVIEQAHKPLHTALSASSRDVASLLSRCRAASRAMAADCSAAARAIDASRRALGAAFADHVAACRALEGVLGERHRGRPARAPEADPWATEGRLVQEQQALHRWQERERAALKSGFAQVTELEQQRLELVKQAMTVTVDSYRAALLPLQHDLADMGSVLGGIQPEVKLSGMRDMAATATRTAEGLGARQAECLHSVRHELFCSPEILRQGDLQLWEPGAERWRKCHFVLTRAGYLHGFARAEDVQPLENLALARCAFEAGKAPRFSILESPRNGGGWLGGIRSRRITFQAGSVEECCEWAIAIREAISVALGKQLAFEDEESAARS